MTPREQSIAVLAALDPARCSICGELRRIVQTSVSGLCWACIDADYDNYIAALVAISKEYYTTAVTKTDAARRAQQERALRLTKSNP